ncbi:MAG: ferredoxin family protein [Candidatus Zixiibacteriota bacterium]
MPEKRKKGCWLVEISENLCKGCEICIEFCPTDVFRKSGKLNRKGYYLPIVAKVEECTGCRICDLLCPELAIVITDEQRSGNVKTDTGHGD